MRYSEKIYKDILESDLTFNIHDIKFYFSSNLYRDKFISRVEDYVKTETERCKKKFGVKKFHGEKLFCIMLYKSIEKRGFRILDKRYSEEIHNPIEALMLDFEN